MGFKVGDRVVIRTWESMAAEFGIDDYGNIPCKFTFTDNMKRLCRSEFVITEIDRDGEIRGHEAHTFHVSEDMIEYCDEELEESEELIDALKSFRCFEE